MTKLQNYFDNEARERIITIILLISRNSFFTTYTIRKFIQVPGEVFRNLQCWHNWIELSRILIDILIDINRFVCGSSLITSLCTLIFPNSIMGAFFECLIRLLWNASNATKWVFANEFWLLQTTVLLYYSNSVIYWLKYHFNSVFFLLMFTSFLLERNSNYFK